MKKLISKIKNLFIPLLGLASLIWFLVRVIPKPSRAAYPCMKAAAPLASTFVIYLTGILATTFAFKKARQFLRQSKYLYFVMALVAGVVFGFFMLSPQKTAKAYNITDVPAKGPNGPIGQGVGLMPGRVAWIYNPDATDKSCSNHAYDYWFSESNTDQATVSKMFSDGLMLVTNTTSDEAAWDSIFHYYNRTHGRGNIGYQAGEKIVMKINQNGESATETTINQNDENKFKKIVTSPQVTFAIIQSLITKAGVAAADLAYGDPWSNTGAIYWNKIQAVYPTVKSWGNATGRTPNVTSSTEMIYSSDGTHATFLPVSFVEATYVINVPLLKKHHRAGISLCSKNHFGTLAGAEGGASNWHFSLPCPMGGGDVSNGSYGQYRCFVDIMGHKHLGGKTILYVIDALWGSTNWAHPPVKWAMAPFNNDWPSSLFMSQDPVAIESVGFDFLYHEFDTDHPTEGSYDPTDNKGPFPHYAGTDDFLIQAADSNNWAEGISYDPEADGTPLPESMGVHEHWNNAIDKQYSKNLGFKEGIELVSNTGTSTGLTPSGIETGLSNHPNPFSNGTVLRYGLSTLSDVTLTIYSVKGEMVKQLYKGAQLQGQHEVTWDRFDQNGYAVPAGIYLAKIMVHSTHGLNYQVVKIIAR